MSARLLTRFCTEFAVKGPVVELRGVAAEEHSSLKRDDRVLETQGEPFQEAKVLCQVERAFKGCAC